MSGPSAFFVFLGIPALLPQSRLPRPTVHRFFVLATLKKKRGSPLSALSFAANRQNVYNFTLIRRRFFVKLFTQDLVSCTND